MKRLLQFVLFAAFAAQAFAQTATDLAGNQIKGHLPLARFTPGSAGQCLTTDSGGNVAWAPCSSGGGTGTVTTFSSGNLAPLFTTSVANPGTTPSLAFTLSNVAAHRYLGNNTGVSGAPAYVQPSSTELADFSATAPTTA